MKMYYQLCWENQHGQTGSKRISTTGERASEWVNKMNTDHPEMKHWFEEISYQNGKINNVGVYA